MTGKKAPAPCGHDGEHVTLGYVRCLEGCDTCDWGEEETTPKMQSIHPELIVPRESWWRIGQMVSGETMSITLSKGLSVGMKYAVIPDEGLALPFTIYVLSYQGSVLGAHAWKFERC